MTGFSSLLCHPFPVPLVNVHGDSDDRVEHVIHSVSFGESILNEGRQVLSVADELVVIDQFRAASMLLEYRSIILDHLGPLS